ncbi:MAG: AAA family ATPase [Candidatus Heimdallarchaeota archaeon]|nr:MAG: AAA family ATPase [Candidatus Heimdallarchaeota archaeon]
MRINKVNLRNFRSIPHLKLENLQNLNCFIGAHNSGKTNILDGISVFWDLFIRAKFQQNQLKKESLGQLEQQAPPILSYISETNTIRAIFELEIDKSLESWSENNYLREIFTRTAFLHTQKQSYDFFNEFLENLETETNLSRISAFTFDMTLSQEQLMFIAQECFLRLKDGQILPFKPNSLSIIQQAIGTAFLRRFDETTEHKFLNENIARIIKNKDYKAITAIESFLKDIIGQEFIFELRQNQTVEVTIEQAFTSPLWRLSNGTIRIISLAYLLTASPINQIIIIDDPGLYLHPKSERRLARKLENFSIDHQILFSTHSTRFLIGHAYLVELIKGWTKVRPIRGEKSMKKVVKLLGIRPSDSLGADVVVFVEGKTDARVFRVFEDLLIEDRMSRNWVSYIGVGGWTNMKFVLSMELLKSKFVRSRAIAITDGDIDNSDTYLKIKKNWVSVFQKNTFLSLNEECIESLFLNNPIVFQRVFSKKNESSISISEVQEIIKRNREKGISDKTITRNITERFMSGKRYTSSVAERLARSFKKNEIPEYLAAFFNKFILN